MIRRPLNAQWAAASLFAAACFLILWAAEGRLIDGPRFGSEEHPLVIEGERLLDCLPDDDKRVGRLKDGARLYANLDMLFHAFTEGEATTLYVVARGKRLQDVPPVLTVEVDRKLQGRIFVGTNEWWLYNVDLDLPPGEHRFRIRYINDRSRFPTNRDVDLRLVALGAQPKGWETYTPQRYDLPLVLLKEPGILPSPNDFDLALLADPREDGSLTLWSNGYLGRSVYAVGQQMIRLTVVARGDICEGAGPRMLIMDNDDQLVSFDVDTASFESYETVLTLAPEKHEILIVYENDLYVPGVCDRNLHVREMRLEKL